ncbi:ras guanine nucleotide exchange factor domain-containing protein [Sporodiniella umbellata]|nr:ras guanine nucleotide exchange factor domain-containing protein [Sporodiniella umbellata]
MLQIEEKVFTIAVCGEAKVEKASFIKHSLPNSILKYDPELPSHRCHKASIFFNNTEYFLKLVEIDDPKLIKTLPAFHGGLLCYDMHNMNEADLSTFAFEQDVPVYKIGLRSDRSIHLNNQIHVMDISLHDLQYVYISLLMEIHDPRTTSEDAADPDNAINPPSDSFLSAFSPSQNKMSRRGSKDSSSGIFYLLQKVHEAYRAYQTTGGKFMFNRFECDGFLPFLTEQQKRIHTIFAYWLSCHWNDFCSPQARRYLIVFLDRISKYDAFTPICDSLAPLVVREPPLTDPDEVWGMTDHDVFSGNKKDSGYISGSFHILQDTPPQSPRDVTAPQPKVFNGLRSAEFAGGMINIDTKGCNNYTASTITAASGWTAHISIMTSFGVEDKLNLKLFMKSSDLHIAEQLTLIDSELFSRIEDREFIRNMWNNTAQPNSNNRVSASIAHFNFISAWVSTLIVSQSRTNKRASVLLKFMSVAIELRNLYNYNSLMAVLAGINNASVLRLKQTRQAVIGKKLYKQFQSLERLMSSDKSFCSYRMALKATKGPGIPYLGIHNQDLVSLAEANKDHRIDGTIHWDKFRLMGETIMSIMKFKYQRFNIKPDRKLLLSIADCPILSEEVIKTNTDGIILIQYSGAIQKINFDRT